MCVCLQGVYVSGAVLVGGRWTGDKVAIVAAVSEVSHSQHHHDMPLTLALCVSHAVPPAPVVSIFPIFQPLWRKG